MSTQPRITEVPPNEVTAENPIAITALGLKKRVEALDQQIKAFSKLATAAEYTAVAEIGIAAARVEKEGEEFYKEEVGRLHKLWQDKCDERGSITKPAKAVKDLAGRLTGEWDREQERLRAAEERRQQEIEREKAETETLDLAASLEKEGRVEEAQSLMESPIEAAPVSVGSWVPTVKGKTKPRDNWQGTVTNMALLVKAVSEGKVPLAVLQVNQSVLNTFARTMLKDLIQWPGVKVTNNPKSAFRS